ncbi:MAG: hypothetical protein QF726_00630 [Alphaproteobacteria bacterium]|jgi:methionine synthase II (cobalamin-independent)|nr:hypothetical protein [Alphaproteobacteria bacterium]
MRYVLPSPVRSVPAELIVPCTDCGMVLVSRDLAAPKMQTLATDAALVRDELGVA